MQLIKIVFVFVLLVVASLTTYHVTKNSYYKQGLSDGELNASYNILKKMKVHITKCHNKQYDSSKKLMQVKTSAVYVLDNGQFCYFE